MALELFIENNRKELIYSEDESDENYEVLKEELTYCFRLINRFYHGLVILKNVYNWDKLKTSIMNMMNQKDLDLLSDVTLFDYL